jgi:hypothetical protein
MSANVSVPSFTLEEPCHRATGRRRVRRAELRRRELQWRWRLAKRRHDDRHRGERTANGKHDEAALHTGAP